MNKSGEIQEGYLVLNDFGKTCSGLERGVQDDILWQDF